MIRIFYLFTIGFFIFQNIFAQQFGTLKDARDGKVYKTVKIGQQEWMAENLNSTHFKNGDSIREVKTDAEWINASISKHPVWCYYKNSPVNGEKYGKLYNWYAVTDPRGLAPEGWHFASGKEIQDLIQTVNSTSQNTRVVFQYDFSQSIAKLLWNKIDSVFIKALKNAEQINSHSNEHFVSLFLNEIKNTSSNVKISWYFESINKINPNESNTIESIESYLKLYTQRQFELAFLSLKSELETLGLSTSKFVIDKNTGIVYFIFLDDKSRVWRNTSSQFNKFNDLPFIIVDESICSSIDQIFDFQNYGFRKYITGFVGLSNVWWGYDLFSNPSTNTKGTETATLKNLVKIPRVLLNSSCVVRIDNYPDHSEFIGASVRCIKD